MALYRFQVVLPADSGLPADASTNTWYHDCDDLAAVADAAQSLQAFYNGVEELLSPLIDTIRVRVDVYRMSDPEPRQIVYTDQFSPLAPAVAPGPTEIALVLSFQADPVSGQPQARRRGRIYLGPLGQTVGDRPDGAVIDLLRDEGAAHLAASNSASNWTWAVYSPTNGEGYNVTNGWVDNEWDTQRRRGRESTNRVLF